MQEYAEIYTQDGEQKCLQEIIDDLNPNVKIKRSVNYLTW